MEIVTKPKRKYTKRPCEHGVDKYGCRRCKGSGICKT